MAHVQVVHVGEVAHGAAAGSRTGLRGIRIGSRLEREREKPNIQEKPEAMCSIGKVLCQGRLARECDSRPAVRLDTLLRRCPVLALHEDVLVLAEMARLGHL